MEENKMPMFRIEDMTLGMIQGLKKQLADEVAGYLAGLAKMISEKFDVGTIGFRVDTTALWLDPQLKHQSPMEYEVSVYFSKEEL